MVNVVLLASCFKNATTASIPQKVELILKEEGIQPYLYVHTKEYKEPLLHLFIYMVMNGEKRVYEKTP